MRYIVFYFSLLLLIYSCRKSDSNLNTEDSIKISYSIDSNEVRPGHFLTMTGSSKLLKDSTTGVLGGKSVFLVKVDSFRYGFFVPELPSGRYSLNLASINAANSPEIIIGSYNAIANADIFINEKMENLKKMADSIYLNSLTNAISENENKYVHQLIDQFFDIIKNCSKEQKINLAYQIQHINIDNVFGIKSTIDTSYLGIKVNSNLSNEFEVNSFQPVSIMPLVKSTFSGKESSLEEIGAQMLRKAMESASYQLTARVSATAVVSSITWVYFTSGSNPYALGAALVSVLAYKLSKQAAARTTGEVANMVGVVAKGLVNENGEGTIDDPIIVSNSKSVVQRFKAVFKTLIKTDRFNNEIDASIDNSYELEEKDMEVKSLVDKFVIKFTAIFTNVKAKYELYKSPFLTTAKERLVIARGQFMSIANISNPKIEVVTEADGTGALKIKFANGDGTIKTVTSFSFRITYTQASLNKKVEFIEYAKFVPDVVVSTTSISNITESGASIGGNIKLTGEVSISAKGICWSTFPNPSVLGSRSNHGIGAGSFTSSISNLKANTKYYYRAYAISDLGTFYGEELNFSTSPSAAVSTSNVTSVTSNTAISGGNVTQNGGLTISTRGVCWSTFPNPTISNAKTSNGSGMGSFVSNISGLHFNTTYYIRAYATNSSGTVYGSQISFKTLEEAEVKIGNQVWMSKNLNVSTYRNGDPIPQVTDPFQWAKLETGAWCYYNNDPATEAIYGKLYNWYAVNDPRGLAPEGWHVPKEAEWSTLTSFLGGESLAGGKMKAISSLWSETNLGATNSSGFTGLPGGHRRGIVTANGLADFEYEGDLGLWWSSSVESCTNCTNSMMRGLFFGETVVSKSGLHPKHGLSVRCVKD